MSPPAHALDLFRVHTPAKLNRSRASSLFLPFGTEQQANVCEDVLRLDQVFGQSTQPSTPLHDDYSG